MPIAIRYVMSLLSSLIVLFLLWFLAVYSQLGKPTASSQWASDLYKQKAAAASHFSGPRLFIVGGSGVHFSVNAEKISKALKIPTINFGTYAGLEVEYFLFKVKQVLRAGDIVLLPLEYIYYADRSRYNSIYLDHLLARDPEFIETRPLIEQAEIALLISMKRLKKSFKEGFSKQTKPAPLGFYTIYYNAYGDTHINNRIFIDDKTRSLREKSTIDSGLFGATDKSFLWSALRPFSKWCRTNKITLLATAPPHQKFDNINNPTSQANLSLIKNQYEKLGIAYLGDSYQAMFDRSFYYDNSYHTNELGKELYSQHLIDLLKENQSLLPKEKMIADFEDYRQDNPVEKVLAQFNGWEPINGIEPIANSYSEKLPIRLSGKLPLVFKIHTIKKEKVLLSFEFQLDSAQDKLVFFVDEKLIWQQNYKKTKTFYQLELPVCLTAGEHLVEIKSDSGKNYAESTLLFKSLLVTTKEVA